MKLIIATLMFISLFSCKEESPIHTPGIVLQSSYSVQGLGDGLGNDLVPAFEKEIRPLS